MVVLLALAATMNVMALTITGKAKITMTCPGQTATAYVAEVTEYAEGIDPSSVLLYDEGAQISVYPIYNSNNYEKLFAKSISNYYMGFKTMTGVTDYTLTFTQVAGTMSIYDQVADQLVNVTEGGTYNFTATANTRVEDRFIINYVPSAPKICHRYGALQVYGSKDMTVKVLNMDGTATSIADTNITTNLEVEIDLAGLATGQYKVEWNSQTLIIDVK